MGIRVVFLKPVIFHTEIALTGISSGSRLARRKNICQAVFIL